MPHADRSNARPGAGPDLTEALLEKGYDPVRAWIQNPGRSRGDTACDTRQLPPAQLDDLMAFLLSRVVPEAPTRKERLRRAMSEEQEKAKAARRSDGPGPAWREEAMKRAGLGIGRASFSCGSLVAYGGNLASLCQDSLAQNRQPDFADGGFQSLKTVQVVGNPAVLRLNTNLDVLNPQKIMLPFDQNVSISYVYQAGGAGWALGWMYADDLVKRGYMDANGNLLDADGDGIPDFHEDIYNVSPSRYIGKFRKCGASPPTFTWNGKSLIEPEIASDTCGGTFGTTSKSAFQADGGIGTVSGWQVGKASGSFPTTATVEFTDNGLYPRVPNLLEPADPANNALGLGHLVFLNADDDSDTTTKSLVPVADISTTVNGVPDYDVSAYDGNGRPLPAGSNPDPGVSLYDRTLNLGTIPGGREIIFYLIVFYGSQSQAACLGRIGGVCKLWLNSPINVWFSRVDLNMDENLSMTSPAATTDIGCGYPKYM